VNKVVTLLIQGQVAQTEGHYRVTLILASCVRTSMEVFIIVHEQIIIQIFKS